MTGPVHRREPDPEKLLKLPVDEIAPYFFEYLYGMGTDPFSRHNVFLNDEVAVDYPATSRASVSARLMEAWGYLERMGVIIPKPGSTEGWYTFATVAKQKGTAEALKKYIDDHFSEPSTRYEKFNEELTKRLAEIEEQISAKTKEATEFINTYEQQARERITKTARKVSVTEAQQQFREAQQTHTTRIKWWGAFAAGSIALFVIVAWVFGREGLSSEGAGAAVYHTAIRVTVLTALAAVATFCLRILRAHMHMREVNLHRQRIANSMAAFVEAAGTDEQADMIFGRMVDAVVAFGSSGLVPDGDDQVLPTKLAIDTVTRSVQSRHG